MRFAGQPERLVWFEPRPSITLTSFCAGRSVSHTFRGCLCSVASACRSIVVIFVVALLVFGPTKLPDLGKSLGEAIRGFKKAVNETEKPPLASDNSRTPDDSSRA